MERIKKMRMVFCNYLYSIAKEKNLTIDEIVKRTNRSYTEIKKIMEGLAPPTLDDLLLISEVLGIQVTLNGEIPLAHKKVAKSFAMAIRLVMSYLSKVADLFVKEPSPAFVFAYI